MGGVLSSPPPHDMGSKTCEHHCCYRECRHRARKHSKRRNGDAAINELLWAAGDLLKEHVKGVKEKRKGNTTEKGHRRHGAERKGRGRDLEPKYRGYYRSGEATEEEGEMPLPNGYGRYGELEEDDNDLSPMDQPRGSGYRRHQPRGAINSHHGPGRRSKTPRSRPISPQREGERSSHAAEFGFANVDSFQHPPRSTGRTPPGQGPWQSNNSNRRGIGRQFST